MEMRAQVEKYEDREAKKASAENQDEASTSTDELDHPQVTVAQMMNENPHHISLRSRAEEEIVNDAKRKKCMLFMCAQSLNKEEINCSPYSIGRLRGLRSLNLASCNRISDVSLKYAFDFRELEQLNLSKCQQITHAGISCILDKCPSINVLHLSDCHNINDEAINCIAMRLQRLTYLHIGRCSNITNASLRSIACYCKRLKYIDVRGCRSINPEPGLTLQNIRSLQHVLMSKPGPYIKLSCSQPKAPPVPSSL